MKTSTANELTRILLTIPADIRCDFTVEFNYKDGSPILKVWTSDPKKTRAMLRDNGVRRRWVKEYTEYNVTYTAKHNGMEIQITTSRGNVCKRIDTGKVELVERVDYSLAPKRMVEEPVYEWICK